MIRRLVLALTTLGLAACISPPAEKTATVDDRPSLLVRNAAMGSQLFVDGLATGEAGKDTGAIDLQQPILLEPGTHVVKVIGPAGGVHEEKVFLSGRGVRIVTIPEGAAR